MNRSKGGSFVDGPGAPRPASYEDILEAPSHMVAELVEGELALSPRPSPRHAFTKGELLTELRRFGTRQGGWIILAEIEVKLGPNVLVPDISGWRRGTAIERAIANDSDIDFAPDWACEVLSATTEQLDRSRKMAIYGKYGVRLCGR